jgi:hypothetical protein
MLTAGARFTGGLVWRAWERVWIRRRLDLQASPWTFAGPYGGPDPAMPILLVIYGAAASVFAALSEAASGTLAIVATGLLDAILVSSIVVA